MTSHSDWSEIIDCLRGTCNGSLSALIEERGLEAEEDEICAAVDDAIFECSVCGWWCEIDEECSEDCGADDLTCRQCAWVKRSSEFHDTWAARTRDTIGVSLWIAYPAMDIFRKTGMIHEVERYCNDVGLCVTLTETVYVFTGGQEPGWCVGLRNYPRFPSDEETLFRHAEAIGRAMAEIGNQGSYMIEQHDGHSVWYTRRLNDGASPQTMAECDCQQPDTCKRTGCAYD